MVNASLYNYGGHQAKIVTMQEQSHVKAKFGVFVDHAMC